MERIVEGYHITATQKSVTKRARKGSTRDSSNSTLGREDDLLKFILQLAAFDPVHV